MEQLRILFGQNSYLIYWAALIFLIWKIIGVLEDTLSDDTKKRLSNWLKDFEVNYPEVDWYQFIRHIFDILFTRNVFSIKFIARSFLASIIVFLFLFCIWASSNKTFLNNFIDDISLYSGSIPLSIYIQVSAFVFLNLIADLFSLVETRYILFIFSRTQNIFKKILLIILDALLTCIIFLLVVGVFWFTFDFVTYIKPDWERHLIEGKQGVAVPLKTNENIILKSVGTKMSRDKNGIIIYDDSVVVIKFKHQLSFINIKDFVNKLFFIEKSDSSFVSPGIYFYTSFFTSIWLWLFIISSFIIKLICLFNKTLKVTVTIFNVDQKPLRTIGIILNSILIIISIIIFPFKYFKFKIIHVQN